MIAALAGISVLLIGVLLLACLIPDEQIRRPMWLFIFFVLTACAVFCWRHPKAPPTSRGWIIYIGWAFHGGLVLAVIDAPIYGLHSGHVVLDLGLSVLGAIIAVSGFVRSVVKEGFRE